MSTFLAFLLPFISGLTGGMCFAIVFTWTLRRFVVELDYRVADLEGRINREVKKRAQEASMAKRTENESLEEWALKQKSEGVSVLPAKGQFNDWWNHTKKGTG